MAEKRECPLCGEPLEDPPAIHDVATCEKTELLKGRETIKKLKTSVKSWIEAWYRYREIVGEMAWQHNNCPYEKKEGENIMLVPQTDVYINGKLVGSVLSMESEAAVRRLMSYPDYKPETKKEQK